MAMIFNGNDLQIRMSRVEAVTRTAIVPTPPQLRKSQMTPLLLIVQLIRQLGETYSQIGSESSLPKSTIWRAVKHQKAGRKAHWRLHCWFEENFKPLEASTNSLTFTARRRSQRITVTNKGRSNLVYKLSGRNVTDFMVDEQYGFIAPGQQEVIGIEHMGQGQKTAEMKLRFGMAPANVMHAQGAYNVAQPLGTLTCKLIVT